MEYSGYFNDIKLEGSKAYVKFITTTKIDVDDLCRCMSSFLTISIEDCVVTGQLVEVRICEPKRAYLSLKMEYTDKLSAYAKVGNLCLTMNPLSRIPSLQVDSLFYGKLMYSVELICKDSEISRERFYDMLFEQLGYPVIINEGMTQDMAENVFHVIKTIADRMNIHGIDEFSPAASLSNFLVDRLRKGLCSCCSTPYTQTHKGMPLCDKHYAEAMKNMKQFKERYHL